MKYLNKFNEGIGQHLDEQKLRDFCEMYLAYLIDDGFEIYINRQKETGWTDFYFWQFRIFKSIEVGNTYSRKEYDKFSWNLIKDRFMFN